MFKSLDKFDIRTAQSWIDIPELGKKARILLKPATDVNGMYYNQMLKLSGKRVRQMVKTDEITAEDAALNRDDDIILYPLYVISDWQGLDAEDGGEVPFNRENSKKLCVQLGKKAPHIMDRMRNHASTPERFYGEDEIAPPDAEALAEN